MKQGIVIRLVQIGSLGLCLALPFFLMGSSGATASRVRTYYIAADEVEWDYAPSGTTRRVESIIDHGQRPWY